MSYRQLQDVPHYEPGNDFLRTESEQYGDDFTDSLADIFGSHVILGDYLLEDIDRDENSPHFPDLTPRHINISIPEQHSQPIFDQRHDIQQQQQQPGESEFRHHQQPRRRSQNQQQHEARQRRQNQDLQNGIRRRKQQQNQHQWQVQQREIQRQERAQRERREQKRQEEQRWHQIQLIQARRQQEYFRKQQQNIKLVQKQLLKRQNELEGRARRRFDFLKFHKVDNNKAKSNIETTDQTANVEDRDLCVVCFINPINVVLIPCGHNRYCRECCEKLANNKCPECRTDIERVVISYR